MFDADSWDRPQDFVERDKFHSSFLVNKELYNKSSFVGSYFRRKMLNGHEKLLKDLTIIYVILLPDLCSGRLTKPDKSTKEKFPF